MREIEIRPCVLHEEFQQCVKLQQLVWEFSDLDVVPVHIFVVCQHTGGFTLGAFASANEMVGFAYALVAQRGGKTYYHSDMLAVKPAYQGQGIGRRLKLAQREYALQHGGDLIVWTFDPLQALNAHFNINRLGACVRRYEADCYGSSSSHLHQGLDTDRVVVEWWLESDRVQEWLAGKRTDMEPPAATIRIPGDINELKTRDLSAACAWQLEVRAQFSQCLAAGLVVGGFEPVGDGSVYQYWLYRDET